MRFPSFAIRAAALAVGALVLTGCSSIGYRCPLDPSKKPESPTACAGLKEAMAGAKQGSGGKTSVLVDDKGRLVPPEARENRPAVPLSVAGEAEPYRTKSGDPVFHQPKVFQAWVPAFVDAEGNLHEGHHSWFSTPGRWAYGSTKASGGEVADNLMRPATPGELPKGRIVSSSNQGQGGAAAGRAQAAAQPQTPQDSERAAMNSLSRAANNAANNQQARPAAPAAQADAGVTAPAIGVFND